MVPETIEDVARSDSPESLAEMMTTLMSHEVDRISHTNPTFSSLADNFQHRHQWKATESHIVPTPVSFVRIEYAFVERRAHGPGAARED